MDLSKLSPAPWTGRGSEGGVYGVVSDADGKQIMSALWPNPVVHAEFAALARNAFAGDPEALAWWEANRVKKESSNG